MADTTKKIVYLDLLQRYDEKIKSHIATKISKIPNEQFLKEAGTQFVQTFAWSETEYPGSVNPQLDGQPVLVLALATKTLNAETGEYDESTTYSFLAMKSLVDVYKAGADTSTVKVTVNSETNEITAAVRVSEVEDNALEVKEDGLFVDTSDKANVLIEDEVLENQILVDDGNGDLKGSKVMIGTDSIQVKVGEYESVSINDSSLAEAWGDGEFEFTDDAEWAQNSEEATFRDDVVATEAAVMKAVPLIVRSVGFEKAAGGFTASETGAETTLITRTNDDSGKSTGYSSTAYTIGTGTVSGTTEGETTTYSDKKLATEAAVMAEAAKLETKINNVSNSLDYATEDDIAAMFV